MKIAEQYNLKVIEDATEALGTYYTGGKYKGKYAGTIGMVGVYFLMEIRLLQLVGWNDSIQYEELLKKKHLTTQAKSDELYYTHDEIGYNYRMTTHRLH